MRKVVINIPKGSEPLQLIVNIENEITETKNLEKVEQLEDPESANMFCKFAIEKVDLENLSDLKILFVGSRGSNKSLIRELILREQRQVHIFGDLFSESKFNILLQEKTEEKLLKVLDHLQKREYCCLVLDDFPFDPKFFNNKNYQWMIYNSRNQDHRLIQTLQFYNDLSRSQRQQFDLIAIGRLHDRGSLKKIWQEHGACFETFEIFLKVHSMVTEKNQTLILMNGKCNIF